MIHKIKENWPAILKTFKEDQELSEVAYNTWLVPLEISSLEDGVLSLIYPGADIALDYLKKKYTFFLQYAIEEVTGIKCQVSFLSPREAKKAPKKKAAPSASPSSNSNLNPKYTFDTFVVGSNNKMAHAAALAVAESPGTMYNPLFIYGGVGLGKTHLMHSIANFVLKNNPDAKVLYVTSETFTNELIDAIRNKNNISTTEFREKYRTNDVLLIDDIQFIIGKEGMQEEVFHTFNSLYEAKKQVIISSDRPPKDMETLEERLRSRFEWGLTVDIQSPDYETRMAILRKKEELEGYNIDNEVIKYVATNVKSNIRELEGALTKIVAFSKLNLVDNQDITVEIAQEALKDLISPNESREITPEIIVNVVCDHYGIQPSDIVSSKRNKEIAYPRQIIMYLCRNMTDVSLQEIGKRLGNRDHSTVLHGVEKIDEDLKNNETLKSNMEILKKKINPS